MSRALSMTWAYSPLEDRGDMVSCQRFTRTLSQVTHRT